MPPREGPRLEVRRHAAAEARIRESILRREQGLEWDYEGRHSDIALCQRKQRERGIAGVRRVLKGEG